MAKKAFSPGSKLQTKTKGGMGPLVTVCNTDRDQFHPLVLVCNGYRDVSVPEDLVLVRNMNPD
jgi:hypothetical protein